MNRVARDHGDEIAKRHSVRGGSGRTRTWRARRSTWRRALGDYVMGETIVVDGGVTLARG
jgi:hypothetical protein